MGRRTAVVTAAALLAAAIVSVALVRFTLGGVPSKADSSRPVARGFSSALHGIACTGASECLAVGAYTDTADHDIHHALAQRWSRGSWSLLDLPSPNTFAVLNSVACPAPNRCLAVGSSSATGDPTDQHALVQAWNGSAWRIAALPAAAGSTIFRGVSCSNAETCVAVGSSTVNGESEALIESWDGKSWTRQTPAETPPGTGAWLESVSCTANDFCMAVGLVVTHDAADGTKTLAESWNGRTWTITPSPSPSTASAEVNALNSVACTSTRECVAVGSYDAGDVFDALDQSLVELWNGTGWKVVPAASGAGSTSALFGISCLASARCVAVGVSHTGSKSATLLEAWDGAAWSSTGGGSTGQLDAIGCPSGSGCLGVGEGGSASEPGQRPLVVAWRHPS